MNLKYHVCRYMVLDCPFIGTFLGIILVGNCVSSNYASIFGDVPLPQQIKQFSPYGTPRFNPIKSIRFYLPGENFRSIFFLFFFLVKFWQPTQVDLGGRCGKFQERNKNWPASVILLYD